MKVLLVSPPTVPLPPKTYGGIERVVSGLASELARRGHSVAILAPYGSHLSGVDCIAWAERGREPFGGSWNGMRRLGEVASSIGGDIIHSFTRAMFSIGLRGRRAPVIHSYQVLPHYSVRLVRSILGSRLTLTGCSEWLSRRGREMVGGQWTAIYNFADVRQYEPRYSVARDAPLVFLSRVDAIKGPDWAIDVALRTNRHLVIAGNVAVDGPNAAFWRTRIEPRLRPGQIDYVGPVDDKQKNKLLGTAAALLVPVQWDEPFGLVFTEALACGTPVVSCPRGSLPEIVRPGIDGFLGRTIDELCEGVNKLDTIDRRACRERVETCFSLHEIARCYENLYESRAAATAGA